MAGNPKAIMETIPSLAWRMADAGFDKEPSGIFITFEKGMMTLPISDQSCISNWHSGW
jgi:hypothetical protein